MQDRRGEESMRGVEHSEYSACIRVGWHPQARFGLGRTQGKAGQQTALSMDLDRGGSVLRLKPICKRGQTPCGIGTSKLRKAHPVASEKRCKRPTSLTTACILVSAPKSYTSSCQ